MANVDAPAGFTFLRHEHGGNITRERRYVQSTYAVNLFVGQCVKSGSSADANGVGDVEAAGLGTTNRILGVIDEIEYDPDNRTRRYHIASTAGYVYVITDPSAIYQAQEDSVGGALTADDVGRNIALIGTSGSTQNGQSSQELDSNTVADATEQIRLVGIIQTPKNVIGANATWEVRINEHERVGAAGAAGV
jgi:hypothetical protein